MLCILKIHSPDCENCNPAGNRQGEDMRARLQELQRTAPRSEAPRQTATPDSVFELSSHTEP
jgi:hypothetical protein